MEKRWCSAQYGTEAETQDERRNSSFLFLSSLPFLCTSFPLFPLYPLLPTSPPLSWYCSLLSPFSLVFFYSLHGFLLCILSSLLPIFKHLLLISPCLYIPVFLFLPAVASINIPPQSTDQKSESLS